VVKMEKEVKELKWNELQKRAKGLKVEGSRNRENLEKAVLKAEAGKVEKNSKRIKELAGLEEKSKYFKSAQELNYFSEEGAICKDGGQFKLEPELLTSDIITNSTLKAGRFHIKAGRYLPAKIPMREFFGGKNWRGVQSKVLQYKDRGLVITLSVKATEALTEADFKNSNSFGNHFLFIIPKNKPITVKKWNDKELKITKKNWKENYLHFSNNGRTYKMAKCIAFRYNLHYMSLKNGEYEKSNISNHNYNYSFFKSSWEKYLNDGGTKKINNPLEELELLVNKYQE